MPDELMRMQPIHNGVSRAVAAWSGCPHTIQRMAFSFEVHTTAKGGGRRGQLTLPHGVVETPVFMPVGTAASVKAVPQSLLEEAGAGGKGAQIILADPYPLYLPPGPYPVLPMR